MKRVLLLILILISNFSFGQNYWLNGRFPYKSYSDKDFGSSPQILCVTQGKFGFTYFGNNQRILVFNGHDWFKVNHNPKAYKTKENTIIQNSFVQSLLTTKAKETYVGRDNNFGKIQYSDSGFLEYKALLIGTEENSFGRVKKIYEVGQNQLIFQAENRLFETQNDKAKEIILPRDVKQGFTIFGSTQINDGIIFIFKNKKEEDELQRYFYNPKNGSFEKLVLPEHIVLQTPKGSLNINKTDFIFDLQGRIFSLKKTDNNWKWNLASEKIFPELEGVSVLTITHKNGLIYAGTDAQGLIIMNEKGEILRNFNLADGLQNSTVNSVLFDSENNLWLALDNGIHFIELSSPLSFYEKDKGIVANVQSLDFFNNQILAATTIDIAVTEKNNFNFEFNTLSVFNEALFDLKGFNTDFGKKYLTIGYNGIYEYFPATKTKNNLVGTYGWRLYQSKADKNVIYVGLDNGIGKLTVTAQGIKYEDVLVDLGGDVIQIAGDKDNLYFGVHSKGVYIYNIKNGKYKLVKLSNANGSKSYYYTEKFGDQIFVGCVSGIYLLNLDNNSLEKFKALNNKFQGDENFQIHRLINQNNKRIWIVFHNTKDNQESVKETGYLEFKNGNYTFTSWPFTSLIRAGISNDIVFPNDQEILFAGLNGVYVYNSQHNLSPENKFKIVLDQITLNNKVISGNPEFAKKMEKIDYANNNVKFNFHSVTYNGIDGLQYSYKLQGFNDDWSEWSDVNNITFNKLPEGEYTLLLKAKNAYNFESSHLKYSFTILPPWYRSWWAYTLYALALLVIVIIIIKLSTQRVKQQNIKLESIVKERTSEIAEQNNLLEQQKSEITLKTKDILDSIKYAKRIQDTILPSESKLDNLFPDHFVLYRPKDIVSGDFYWATERDECLYFSAIDCTGHGVPGALVSIVGHNSLLRTINEFQIREPHSILDKLRELVLSAFLSQGQIDVKDGMDIALCSIDKNQKLLKYAGAYNECVIIRNGEIFELSPDKQPIGQFTHAKPFSLQTFELQSGDSVYLFTDGYVDQFGGEKAKKYKSRPFKNKLQEIGHLPMIEQKKILTDEYNNWKGDLDQIDDVCVFGVKFL